MGTNQVVRTRFAPSPTGYLHVGSARTALFSWAYARRHKGVFILRIEDTDRERSTDEAIQIILEGMEWLGLDYDEGPYYQTKRFDRYKEVAEQLIKEGKAYRCYCSKQRLEALREQQQQQKQKPRYDGHCREANHSHQDDKPYVIRFRNPQEGAVTFDDMIRGEITVSNSELDDLIIARSDGAPTYNFTVVVDDWDMGITHVIRGDDHINNTPRQINILKAFGATPPRYAHVPMILGGDGKKLSKRHGAASVLEFREQGYLPQAMRNYLARLGWSHGDQEIFSDEELITLFDTSAASRSPAMFDMEKLNWLNQHYLKTLDVSLIAPIFAKHLQQMGIHYEHGPALEAVIALQAERSKTVKEMADKSRYFYQTPNGFDEKAASKHLTADVSQALVSIAEAVEQLSTWDQEALHQIIIQAAEQQQLKLGKVAQPVRVAITGDTVSPPIDATLFLIGKEEVVKRLKKAVEYIAKM